MSATLKGMLEWSVERDQEGYRQYKIKWLVETDDKWDGPQVVSNTPGLASIGSTWQYGNESDPWSFCWPNMTITPVVTKEPNYWWHVDQIFTNKPLKRCQSTTIENPLNEPPKISGSFVRYTRKTEVDGLGNMILSSSHEPIPVDRDDSTHEISIEVNSLVLGLPVYTALLHCVNDRPLWGLLPRRVKFSNMSWQRQLYGTCTFFFTKKMDFEIKFNGWDESEVADAGYKVFDASKTNGDRTNPTHYKLAVDDRGNSPPQRVLLDGNGERLTDATNPVFLSPILLYPGANLLTLGIPSTF